MGAAWDNFRKKVSDSVTEFPPSLYIELLIIDTWDAH